MRIALVGDYDRNSPSHIATENAVRHSADALRLVAETTWISTEYLTDPSGIDQLLEYHGIWITPGSPYRSMEGVLTAITTVRERGIPAIGTCGGFQHMIIEYARSILGLSDAEHGECSPNASRLFISRLQCSLVGRTLTIALNPGSLVAQAYGQTTVDEEYYCNFGVNPDYAPMLRNGLLRIVGSDNEGEVRVIELSEHPFFVGTLFLPQTKSTPSQPHPLISAFIRACLQIRTVSAAS